jgi:hypothetical protein
MMTSGPSSKYAIRWFAFLLLLPLLLAPISRDAGSRAQELQDAWKFAVIGDTHGDNKGSKNETCINESVVRAIAEDIGREKPDFMLVSGDLISGWFRNGGVSFTDQYAMWKEFMQPVYRSGIKVYTIRGNHDSGPERLVLPPLPSKHEPLPGDLERLEKAYKKAFGRHMPQNGPKAEKGLTYSFVHKNAFIIGLDQYTGGQHKINQAWLDEQLAQAGTRHVIVYGHEPAFQTGLEDNLACFPKDRDLFWDSLGRAGAKAYLCGHDHFYNRASIADSKGREIRQIIEGTGGGTLKTWFGSYKDKRVRGEYHDAEHRGYLLVTVEGPRATISWKAMVGENGAIAWKTMDFFSYDNTMDTSFAKYAPKGRLGERGSLLPHPLRASPP